ncbi:TetR/AcrR family transcriptional regulator [Acinetobacter baumannii]|uniref:TetR/AcrR family transcriptional regulator n=1 Tax=Acinetobacter baumannii TaxID=470 RepID=UPI00044F3C3A|nr:TetR/AcrR family transcriptional regulator [Acinetobacter baumannii]EXB89757.1 bacterial regulatory s, tetR family protein [Acinetobacter baumannii 466760]EXE21211.1 bacterial regulatory s, tetR family protein [Acinetobacter baumannii 50595]EXH93150.1 bacterial regulatory s, tetR family protein [Acinetobacter baumannii 3390]EXQ83193.1 bacterial regulatory s, tetR family protein [Acinetobacter baumannii 1007214]KCY36321.1 bacterial regulatory s, tetR family protein [Acinetobacter baumannii 1
MHNLKNSSKKLQVIHTAIRLFVTYGFHTTGVDLIIKEAKITKATFYNYFHSKERLIEMCIAFQKSLLKEEVLAIIYSNRYRTSKDKLKEIINLHVNFNSLYYLLLKAFFEIKHMYVSAYRMAVEYRRWLLHEIFDLIFSLETHVLKPDVNLVLNLIDGLMFQILSLKSLEERDVVVEGFFGRLGR